MDFLGKISSQINELLLYLGAWTPIIACLFILIESIVAIIPLSVFITINFVVFGPIMGFILSWLFTVLGCILSFLLIQDKFQTKFEKKIRDKKYVKKLMIWLEKAKFQHLVVLVAMPFTPAFLFNIASGLSKMSFRKFIFVIIIGKIFLIYFWGFVGTALLESLIDPSKMIKVVISTIVAYILSSFFNKKFGLD